MRNIVALSFAALLGLPGAAGAQEFPQKGRSITTIVPSTAGGGTDAAARLIAPLMEKALGVPVEIVNKPGASMQIGLSQVAAARPDGQTLVWSVLPTAASIYLDPDRQSSFQRKDLAPIGLFYQAPFSVVVLANSPYKTLKDVVEAAKVNPGKIKSGTTGFMSTGHFANIAFQNGTDVKMATVNFQGGGPELTALLGGHIDLGFSSVGEVISHYKSGTVRVLAVMHDKRLDLLPDVPTVKEAGYDVASIGSNIGLSAPAKTPTGTIERMSKVLQTSMQDEKLRTYMIGQGYILDYLDPAGYSKIWDEADARFKPLIEEAKKQGE